MKTNIDKIIKLSIQGSITHPKISEQGFRMSYDGKNNILPFGFGINYNFYLGDQCLDLIGDEIEAGVSTINVNNEENNVYNSLACIGNEATIVTGPMKGKKGFVSGKYGGKDHVILTFEQDIIENLTMNDEFLIKSYGQGLKLVDYENINIMNIDPSLIDKMNIIENNDGTISVKVKAIVPSFMLGTGLNSSTLYKGDYDIKIHDFEALKKYHLDKLCFGDLLYLENYDKTLNSNYLKKGGSIGVIVHGPSTKSQKGPGVCILMTSCNDLIKPILDDQANLKEIMQFRK